MTLTNCKDELILRCKKTLHASSQCAPSEVLFLFPEIGLQFTRQHCLSRDFTVIPAKAGI